MWSILDFPIVLQDLAQGRNDGSKHCSVLQVERHSLQAVGGPPAHIPIQKRIDPVVEVVEVDFRFQGWD